MRGNRSLPMVSRHLGYIGYINYTLCGQKYVDSQGLIHPTSVLDLTNALVSELVMAITAF